MTERPNARGPRARGSNAPNAKAASAKSAGPKSTGPKPASRGLTPKKSPSDKRRAAEVEKEFGKNVRRAAERSGRKPRVWQNAERPESRDTVRKKIGAGAVQKATTRTWDEWRETLADEGMAGRTHQDVVQHLMTEHGLTSWWSHMVCTNFEEAQRPAAPTPSPTPKPARPAPLPARVDPRPVTAGANLEVQVTRTIDASASDAFRAFNDSARRGWITSQEYLVRTAIAPRSLQLGLPDGSTVQVRIDRKGNRRCVVAILHGQLVDQRTADRAKAMWRDALNRLAEMSATGD
ncbi:MAG: hypothetical protein IT353_02575 [Gemmatimonadaceae bacterium]|nr:hypothetical protein [Gemmatimonadaceae bacterium]